MTSCSCRRCSADRISPASVRLINAASLVDVGPSVGCRRGLRGRPTRGASSRRPGRRGRLRRLDPVGEVGRVAQQVGRLAHLPHRLVEHAAHLVLEAVAHLLQLGVRPPGPPQGVGQLLGTEHDQRQQQDHDDLAAGQVEHAAESMVLPSSGAVQQRLPSLLADPIAFAHRGARAHAAGEHAGGVRAGPAPGRDRAGERRLADRRRRAGARPRRRRAGRPPAPRAVARCRATSCRRTSRSLADLLRECGTDYHLSLDLKDVAAGPVVIDAGPRRRTAELLPRLWLCHPDLDAARRAAARSTRRSSSSTRPASRA